MLVFEIVIISRFRLQICNFVP